MDCRSRLEAVIVLMGSLRPSGGFLVNSMAFSKNRGRYRTDARVTREEGRSGEKKRGLGKATGILFGISSDLEDVFHVHSRSPRHR
jgi:hypothetical protein